MKPLTLVCFGLFALGVGIGLIQLWAAPWSADLFAKLLITDGALFAIVFVISFLIRENRISEKIDKGNSLD